MKTAHWMAATQFSHYLPTHLLQPFLTEKTYNITVIFLCRGDVGRPGKLISRLPDGSEYVTEMGANWTEVIQETWTGRPGTHQNLHQC